MKGAVAKKRQADYGNSERCGHRVFREITVQEVKMGL